jgi:predicted metal-dependent hydrolase
MSQPARQHRSVKARRIRFEYAAGSLPRHYVQGDLVMSHVVAVLSATFPEGEEFFVRSVRHYADRITDPGLQEQVKGFIGQEVTHGREHRALNDRLAEMGYPTRLVDRTVAKSQARLEARTPPRVRLAATAALEHFTAVLAEAILRDERIQDLLGTSEVREMLLWHALEECEHKAVAFDVYRAVGGSEQMRIRVMRAVRFAFISRVTLYTLLSLAGDRSSYNPVRLARSLAALRRSPFLAPEMRRAIKAYDQVGFHPDDSDTEALLARWTTELFGEEGRLAGNVR